MLIDILKSTRGKARQSRARQGETGRHLAEPLHGKKDCYWEILKSAFFIIKANIVNCCRVELSLVRADGCLLCFLATEIKQWQQIILLLTLFTQVRIGWLPVSSSKSRASSEKSLPNLETLIKARLQRLVALLSNLFTQLSARRERRCLPASLPAYSQITTWYLLSIKLSHWAEPNKAWGFQGSNQSQRRLKYLLDVGFWKRFTFLQVDLANARVRLGGKMAARAILRRVHRTMIDFFDCFDDCRRYDGDDIVMSAGWRLLGICGRDDSWLWRCRVAADAWLRFVHITVSWTDRVIGAHLGGSALLSSSAILSFVLDQER